VGRSGRRGDALVDPGYGREDETPGSGEPRYFIGSADLMERNLDRRVEVLAPVLDPELRGRLDETLELNLMDDVSTWELGSDGVWSRVPQVLGVATQRRLQELAVERAHKRRASEMHA